MTNLTRRVTATAAATALVARGFAAVTFTTTPTHAAIGECVAGNPTETVTIFAFNDFHGGVVDDAAAAG